MATATLIDNKKPDVQLTMTWEEAQELLTTVGRSSDSYKVYTALTDALRDG